MAPFCRQALAPPWSTRSKVEVAADVAWDATETLVASPSEGTHMADQRESEEWQVLGVRSVYESRWVKLEMAEVQLPSGQHFEHHKVTMPAAAMAVVLSDDGERVLLSWRHRFAADLWNYELPGGLIEEGEPPEDTVVREIAEETGYRPKEVRHLVTFEPMIGMVSSPHQLFLAQGVEWVAEPTELDEGKFEWVEMSLVPELIRAGKISNSGTLVGLLHVLALGGLEDPK